MQTRVVILGAGFGGLELATTLSEALGDEVDVTLIDKSDAFVFGFSKLDVMFGRTTPEAVRMPYREIVKPGVRSSARRRSPRSTPRRGGSRPTPAATRPTCSSSRSAPTTTWTPRPGSPRAANEFYSVAGAERLRDVLPAFSGGRVVVGVCGAPFKCPPAPSECALLLHDYFLARGVRERLRDRRS